MNILTFNRFWYIMHCQSLKDTIITYTELFMTGVYYILAFLFGFSNPSSATDLNFTARMVNSLVSLHYGVNLIANGSSQCLLSDNQFCSTDRFGFWDRNFLRYYSLGEEGWCLNEARSLFPIQAEDPVMQSVTPREAVRAGDGRNSAEQLRSDIFEGAGSLRSKKV